MIHIFLCYFTMVDNVKLLIFDLDQTLYDTYNNRLFPDVITILSHAHSLGLYVGLASYNINAVAVLERFGILPYFHHVMCQQFPYNNPAHSDYKISMLTEVMTAMDCHPSNTLFFDDSSTSVRTALKLGMKARRVRHTVGITVYDYNTALELV